MTYPVDVTVDYEDGMRSRGLAVAGIFFPIKMLLALPHLVVLWFVQVGAFFVTLYGYFAIAFTGSLPPSAARYLHNALGWNVRMYAWIASLRDEYPAIAMEQPEYQARVVVTEPTLERSRGLAVAGILFLVKAILLIPHFFVLYFVQIVAGIAGWLAFWAIAFTGKYPQGMFDFVVGTIRWYMRTTAWLLSLTDEYPPFGLK